MIDPKNVTQPNASREWKEEFALFAACVAGKGAAQQSVKLDQFLKDSREWIVGWGDFTTEQVAEFSPFRVVQELNLYNGLDIALKHVKLGQYARLYRAFMGLSFLNVETCTVADLEAIKGIGPKTARFFILHTRKDAVHAVLDTHILKYMNAQGIKAPKSTPSGKKYLELEIEFLKLAAASGLSPADFDLQVWKSYSSK